MTDDDRTWIRVKLLLLSLTGAQLHKLIRLAGRELRERWEVREAQRTALLEGMGQMANFTAGVTWALACRAALRESKEHYPAGGRRPQHGAMWLPWEVLHCVRHQVRDRGWHPITCKSWSDFAGHFTAEMRAPAGPVRDGVAHFKIQLARQSAATVFEVPRSLPESRTFDPGPVETRFDVGGEA